MEITSLSLYLITRLDRIKTLMVVASAISTVLAIILLFGIADMMGSDLKLRNLKPVLWCGIMSVLFFVAIVLTPTTKEAAAIYLVPKVANSQEVKKTCGELYNLAVDWLHELKPHKNGK